VGVVGAGAGLVRAGVHVRRPPRPVGALRTPPLVGVLHVQLLGRLQLLPMRVHVGCQVGRAGPRTVEHHPMLMRTRLRGHEALRGLVLVLSG